MVTRESWRDDAARWNARYAEGAPTFEPHPFVAEAFAAGFPEGPVLELACGRSGSALALAERGRRVLAVDVSDVALRQLHGEARRRGLADRVWCVRADLRTFALPPEAFGFVLATLFWDPAVFRAARDAVAPGGLLGWEALTGNGDAESRRFRVSPGELSASLGARWEVLREDDGDDHGPRWHETCRLLARAARE